MVRLIHAQLTTMLTMIPTMTHGEIQVVAYQMLIPTLVCYFLLQRLQRDRCFRAGVFFSKDRREEVIEVGEEPEMVTISGTSQTIQVMTQGQWMKGCPEGGEQSFLFGLYDQLSGSSYPCPECKHPYPRKKSDFFALFVSWRRYVLYYTDLLYSLSSRTTLKVCVRSCASNVRDVLESSVLHVENQYQPRRFIAQAQLRTTTRYFTALTCRVSFSVLDFPCLNNFLLSKVRTP